MSYATSKTASQSDVRIVLGPTNTGKTHLAMERMLGYSSGMIGLPLRLLAREVYDRLLKGDFGTVHSADIALITGEEKIIPPKARYFICTVEAMPVSRAVEFLAIDEIQLATDPERGHIFTDRLLHARGDLETMILGAETMRPIIQLLLPKAQIETRSRFSALRWAGAKKLSRLPRRTAIAAFSVENVYAIAEVIRQQKGGAAVVMGALSPRTRNAQVELYQSGEVDFLVATDAIGMGLNMDIDHVTFAQTRKFDGRSHRALTPAELAQIAGRAGRHTSDGSFGVTGDVAEFEDEQIARIENHEFDPVKLLMWRNTDLDFASPDSLLLSLEAPSSTQGLVRAPIADDVAALTFMRRQPDITDRTQSSDRVRLLWDVAQIPDFRKTMAGDHASLLGEIFLFLSKTEGRIDPNWLETRINHCERYDGDLDTLSTRIAHIRTWNYVAHKNDWLDDPKLWQERCREVEDRLSDALHQGLTKQFVDGKSSTLMRRLKGREDVSAEIDENGDITIEGEFTGRLNGLTLQRDPRLKGAATGAARRAVELLAGATIQVRAQAIASAEDQGFSIDLRGNIIWEGAPIAKVKLDTNPNDPSDDLKGINFLQPQVALICDEMLNGPSRQTVETRVQKWIRDFATVKLSALSRMGSDETLDGLARGLAFRLLEAKGSLPRSEIASLLSELDQPARASLRKIGVRFGAYNIFIPELLKPAAAHFLALCTSISLKRDPQPDLHFLPRAGLTSATRESALPPALYRAAGYQAFGTRVIRVDMLERLADMIRAAVAADTSIKGFRISDAMLSIMGCSVDELSGILRELGYEEGLNQTPIKKHQEPAETAEKAAAVDAEIIAHEKPANTKIDDARAVIWVRKSMRANGQKSNRGHKLQPSGSKKQHKEKSHVPSGNTSRFAKAKRPPKNQGRGQRPEKKIDPDNPFAALAQLQKSQTKTKNK